MSWPAFFNSRSARSSLCGSWRNLVSGPMSRSGRVEGPDAPGQRWTARRGGHRRTRTGHRFRGYGQLRPGGDDRRLAPSEDPIALRSRCHHSGPGADRPRSKFRPLTAKTPLPSALLSRLTKPLLPRTVAGHVFRRDGSPRRSYLATPRTQDANVRPSVRALGLPPLSQQLSQRRCCHLYHSDERAPSIFGDTAEQRLPASSAHRRRACLLLIGERYTFGMRGRWPRQHAWVGLSGRCSKPGGSRFRS